MLFTQLILSKDKVFSSAYSLPVRKSFCVIFCSTPLLDHIFFIIFFLSNSYLVSYTLECTTATLDERTELEKLSVNKIHI